MPRPIIYVIGPSIAYIELTQDKFACIDLEDAYKCSSNSWHAVFVKRWNFWYAKRGTHVYGKPVQIYLHRFIHGDADTPTVDHKNRETLDCRKANLRSATVGQNAWNRKISSSNSTGEKGLLFPKYGRGNKRWIAKTWKDRKCIYLGNFHTRQEAVDALRSEVPKIHGEFVNFG